MNVFELFETNDDFEKNGKWMDFGSFRVLLARSGGNNSTWYKEVQKELKKAGKATWEALGEDEADDIIKSIYANAIIKNHQIKDADGNWVQGVYIKEDDEIKVVDFTPDNMKLCLKQLPEYFKRLREWSDDYKTFRTYELKDKEKN